MTTTIDELRYQFSAEFGELDRAFAKVERLAEKSGLKMEAGFKRGGNAATVASTKIAAMNKVITGVGVAFAAVGFSSLVGGIFNVNKEFQDLRSSLKTVMGSASLAKKAFGDIKNFAGETPYAVKELTDGFIKMGNLGIKPTMPLMRSFGNTASAMGKSFNQMIEAVADASTSEFERLKEFGIKAKQQGDKVTFTFQGVATQIGNNSAEIIDYLKNIGDANFGGAMADKMKNLSGLTSNLGDKVDNLFDKMGQAGANAVFVSIIESAGVVVDAFANNLDVVGAVLIGLSVTIGTILLPTIISATAAFATFTATMLLNPFVAVAVAIGAAIAWFIVFKDELFTIGGYTATLSDFLTVIWDGIYNKISGVLSSIQTTIGDWISTVSSLFSKFKKWVGDAFSGISKKASEFGTALTKLANNPWAVKLKNLISSIVDAYFNMVSGSIAAVMTIPTAVVEMGSLMVVGFKNAVKTSGAVIDGLINYVKGKFSALGDYLSSFLDNPFGSHSLKDGGGLTDAINSAIGAAGVEEIDLKATLGKVTKEFTSNKSFLTDTFNMSNITKQLKSGAKELGTVAKVAMDDLSKVTSEAGAVVSKSLDFTSEINQIGIAAQKRKSKRDHARKKEEELDPTIKAVLAEPETAKAVKEIDTKLGKMRKSAGGAGKALKGAAGSANDEASSLKNYADKAEELIGGIKDATKGLFTDIFKNGKSAFEALSNFASNILDKITDMFLDSALDSLFGSKSGGGFLSDLFGSILGGGSGGGIAGARAKGGPVGGGKTYLVGENGPELFSSSQSGFIHPNEKLNAFNGQASSNIAPNIQVTVNNAPPNMTVSKSQNNVEFNFEELVDQVDGKISQNMREGQGNLLRAIKDSM